MKVAGGPDAGALEVMTMTAGERGSRRSRRGLRCRLGFHSWGTRHNDSGERYSVCERCGKADEWTPTGLGWQASA